MTERLSIFEALGNSPAGLTVSELVGVVGASDSQIRRNLSALVAAGSVTTAKQRRATPGRPSLTFRLSQSGSGWPDIVRMLIGALHGVDSFDQSILLSAGRKHGAAIAAGEFPEGIVDAMAAFGFAPRDVSSARDERERARRVSFQTCPFRDAVASDGGHAVCALHQGLGEGLSAALGGHVDLFEVREPISAGCQIRLVAGAPASETQKA